MWYLIWAFCPFVVSAGVRQKYEKKLRTNFEQISSFLVTYKEGVERNLGEIRKKIYATILDKSHQFWSPRVMALKEIRKKFTQQFRDLKAQKSFGGRTRTLRLWSPHPQNHSVDPL